MRTNTAISSSPLFSSNKTCLCFSPFNLLFFKTQISISRFTVICNTPMTPQDKDEEEEEAEEFFESNDRLLSSASASASSAVSEEDEEALCSNSQNGNFSSPPSLPIPKFPISSVSNFDIWVSDPLSIEERRKRLLHEMGLNNDPLLSRRDRMVGGKLMRSGSSNHLRVKSCDELKSESAEKEDHPCTSSSSASCSVDLVPIKSHVKRNSGCVVVNGSVNNYKLPTGINGSRRSEEMRPDFGNVKSRKSNSLHVIAKGNGGMLSNVSDFNGAVEEMSKIKNLDDGKETVRNGVRKDGIWSRVKEIGSGYQLELEEFEMHLGHSPIVQELLQRQDVEGMDSKKDGLETIGNRGNESGLKSKKKGWFKSLRNGKGAGNKERRSSKERDSLCDNKSGRRSSSATDDSQDGSFNAHEKVKVRLHGKSSKELTVLYKNQEIQAHKGSIWSIEFSLDGRYLASAGEDCIIHIWQVIESEKKGVFLSDKQEDCNFGSCGLASVSSDLMLVPPNMENHPEKKRRGRPSISRKSASLPNFVVPDRIFSLSEKPVCSFHGHLDDVLDLSWSKSQHLLSSSMDKTVRLWHMANTSCLKVFSHSDYVTCIQFNPVDDRHFISGSLDARVRIWNIPSRKVVDWDDLHEMVTAACYSPDGQTALVGSSKGSCIYYNTSENKLHQKSEINLRNKKNRSHLKKITGFQFVPGSTLEVLITSADSRIRVVDGIDLVHKFKGFRNTNSQISASMTANGKHVICASEDSYVYVWKNESYSQLSRNKVVSDTHSYEYFQCRNVSVAIPWPGLVGTDGMHNSDIRKHRLNDHRDIISAVNNLGSQVMETNLNSGYYFNKLLVTWPEEKLPVANRSRSSPGSFGSSGGVKKDMSAWGMVIVTASLKGGIKIFQNFGLPV